MILFRRSINQRLLSSLHTNLIRSFCKNKPSSPTLIRTEGNDVEWNFKALDDASCKIDCLMVLNNSNFNLPWFKRISSLASSILLVDGGANVFHSLQLGVPEQSIPKVKAIIGDLDSIKPEVQKFYRSKNFEIVKDKDQQKNDFEKSLLYGVKMGYKNIVISGAFGDRLDHTFGTMSIAERILKANPQLNLILTNGSSIYCPLRTGFKHKIILSEQIKKVGCGLITFQKITNVKTTGFKWNLGQKDLHDSIEWGKFLSTSNEIVENEVIVDSKDKSQGLINFIAHFKDQTNEEKK